MASEVTPQNRLTRVAKKSFERLFKRTSREVYFYGKPSVVGRDSSTGGDLFIDEYDSYVEETSLDYQDSSTCLAAIVVSAEPAKTLKYGDVLQVSAGSFHAGSFYVVFKLEDVLFNDIAFPGKTLFDREGDAEIGWDGDRYYIDSFSKEGFGTEDFFVKVLVHKIT